MRIVLIPDTHNWATATMSHGLAAALPEDWEVTVAPSRGSKNKWEIIKNDPPDIFYSWLWFWTRKIMDFPETYPNSKLLVGCTGYKKLLSRTYHKIMSNGHITAVNTWCQIMYDLIMGSHPNIWLTRHGTDLELFKPGPSWDGEFRAGWIGNVHHSQKNSSILNQIEYPLLVHGRRAILVEGPRIIQDIGMIAFKDMPSVYRKFNVYVCISKGETGPLPVLEAAAMGLPVVSTAVGIVPELLQPEWVINETQDREIIIREANTLLGILEDSRELREEVGARNREEMEKYWSWEACAPKWVEYFESV